MKEAVVFIVDTSTSMTQVSTSPSANGERKLDLAKKIVSSMVGMLLVQSPSNLTSVVVLKTQGTANHKVAEGQGMFQNITEIPPEGDGLSYPCIETLRTIDQIRSFEDDTLDGDFCDGIVLASDAIFSKTATKKFRRRIVLLTDAGHKVRMNPSIMTKTIHALNEMDCPIHVVAFDFESQEGDMKMEDSSDGSSEDGSSDADTEATEDEVNNEPGVSIFRDKYDCEQLLIDLVNKTQGHIHYFSSVDETLASEICLNERFATLFHMDFSIAPGVDVGARFYKIMSTDESGKLKFGVFGAHPQEVGSVKSVKKYFLEDDPDDLFDEEDTASAVRYGTHFEVISKQDESNLKQQVLSRPRICIIKYVSKDSVRPSYLMESPYAVSGNDSLKSCTVLESFASALLKSNKVAIAFFWKRAKSNPCLSVVFPADDSNRKQGQLIVFQIPYAGEVKELSTMISDEEIAEILSEVSKEQSDAYSDFILSKKLAKNELNPAIVSSPFAKAWQGTIVARSKDAQHQLVTGRVDHTCDLHRTPSDSVGGSSSPADRLSKSFGMK